MKLLQLLQEDNGNYSATRFIAILWSVTTLVMWLIACFKTNPGPTLVEIPSSVLTILGLLFGGKVVQKFGEGKNPSA